MATGVAPRAESRPLMTNDEVASICAASGEKLERLRAAVKGYGSALVAFSGGVDSTFVLRIAVEQLGARALAITALSASVSSDEADEARALAATLEARHVVVDSHELDDPRYTANPSNRCYEIRAWSHRLGLPTWDKPQLACLASRLPYGTQVTVERLNQVGRAERALRELGFKVFRVRYHQEVARLEVSADELSRLMNPELRAQVDQAVKAAGFTFVAIDLEPFRTGRLNDSLKKGPGVSLPVVS